MRISGLLLLLALPATSAFAQEGTQGPDSKIFHINTRVPPLCILGDVTNEQSEFDVGVLTDRSTGFLRRDLDAPTKRLHGSFCNSPSQLSIDAVLMTPVDSRGTPRTGFSRGVHFTATARGWTDNPATFRTNGPDSQPSAIQIQPRPREADILVDVSDFAMNGGQDLRPIASRRYEGLVIVTLGPTP